MSLPVLGTLALGGIAALDATPVAQTLFSQPLVTAALLGALWGEWRVALDAGIVLQVLAASTMPVGARTPEDYATGGVVGVGVAVALASRLPFTMAHEACALLGVLAGLLTATLGAELIRWQRRRNEGLARWCEAELTGGRESALVTAHAAAAMLAFAVGVGWTAATFAIFVFGLGPLAAKESLHLARAWSLAQPVWLGLGLAQILNAFLQRRLTRAALFGASLFAAWLVLMVGGR